MKKEHKTSRRKSSRRSFFRKATAGVVGSAFAAPPMLYAQPAPPHHSPTGPRPNDENSKMLGPTSAHPMGSPFNDYSQVDKMRLPGWRCDTAAESREEKHYFLEEAVLRDKTSHFHTFQPPNRIIGNDNTAFEEPTSSTAADWLEFNTWILGRPFAKKPGDNFDYFIEELLKRVRVYNAALYWMRRLHFYQHAKPAGTLPPRNPRGDKEPTDSSGKPIPPDRFTPRQMKTAIYNAQDDWVKAIDKLNSWLAGEDPNFPHVLADMVEANNYIVSIRVVAQKDAPVSIKVDGITTKELGGSSSSHISVTSAFCSGCA